MLQCCTRPVVTSTREDYSSEMLTPTVAAVACCGDWSTVVGRSQAVLVLALALARSLGAAEQSYFPECERFAGLKVHKRCR